MANPKFYVGDLEQATFTMSEAEDPAYPLSNLSNYIPSFQWRSPNTDANQTLNIDFGSAIARDFVIIENHNFDTIADFVTLQVDNADNPAFTAPLEVCLLTGLGNGRVKVAFTSKTKRYWRLIFEAAGSLAAVPQLGQIFINQVFDAAYSYEWPEKAKNEAFQTEAERAISGLMRTSANFKGVLMFEMAFKNMPDSFETNWLRFHQKVRGQLCPFYYSDPDAALWYVHLDKDVNDIEAFRYQINNLGRIRLVTQGVHQNPLS